MMKTALIVLIRFYRKYVSPLKPPCSPFTPTCCTYALEAVENYGAPKRGWLALKRILKCHPFHQGGYDPVPEGFSDRQCTALLMRRRFFIFRLSFAFCYLVTP